MDAIVIRAHEAESVALITPAPVLFVLLLLGAMFVMGSLLLFRGIRGLV